MLIVSKLQATPGFDSQEQQIATGLGFCRGSVVRTRSWASCGHTEAGCSSRRGLPLGCCGRLSSSRWGGRPQVAQRGKGVRPLLQCQTVSDSIAHPTRAGRAHAVPAPGLVRCRVAQPLPWEPAGLAVGTPEPRVSACTGEARGEPGAALGPQWELAVSVLRRRAAHRPGPGTIDRHTCEAALGRPSGTAAPATGPKAGFSGFFSSGL